MKHKTSHVCSKRKSHETSNKIKWILLKGTTYWYITHSCIRTQNDFVEIHVIC